MHTTTAIHSLLLLLCTIQALSSPFSSLTKTLFSPDLPIMNAYATNKGHVPIYKDDTGFYVAVDLTDDSYMASDSEFGPDTVQMMLGLYTSHTLLAQDCLDFQVYNCSNYASCDPFSSAVVFTDYPSFSTGIYHAWLDMYLDYNNWELDDWSSIAVSCSSQVDMPFANTRYGILGLGVDGGSATNFISFMVFSIHIDQDMSGGLLLFGVDLDSYADSSSPVATLSPNVNWITNISGSIQVGDSSINNINSSIMFDMNEETVGFPLHIYHKIINDISSNMDIDCSLDTYYPTCSYSGSVEGLPDIVLNLDNGQSITIPSSVYVKNQTSDGDGVILNLRGLNNSLGNVSFVTPAYENCIILGYNFIANYYTVFNATEGLLSITLYPTATPSNTPSWVITLIEVVGALAFVLICVCLYCVCRKKFKRKIRPRPTVGTESSGAPLMIGYNPTSMVYTNYDSTHEHAQSVFAGTFSHQLDGQEDLRATRFRTMRGTVSPGHRHEERPNESFSEDSNE